jgi:hypothetical protein
MGALLTCGRSEAGEGRKTAAGPGDLAQKLAKNADGASIFCG